MAMVWKLKKNRKGNFLLNLNAKERSFGVVLENYEWSGISGERLGKEVSYFVKLLENGKRNKRITEKGISY